MRHVAVVGAGPTGLYLATALARRGHRVTVIDRDPAPTGPEWSRPGVMQFHHPHVFREQAVDALVAEMPDVYDALLARDARPATMGDAVIGLNCRRSTLERQMRSAAEAEPRIRFRTGVVGDVIRERGRVTGVRVAGLSVEADLVLNAGGRQSRLGDDLRDAEEGAEVRGVYVSRQHVLEPGAQWGPMTIPWGLLAIHRGYGIGVYPQDERTFTTLFVREAGDVELAGLRHAEAYEAACAAIPSLAAWTDPDRSHPVGDPRAAAGFRNAYRGQGTGALPGLVHVGDAVCQTSPIAARGVATSLMQARRLVALLDTYAEAGDAGAAFDAWCECAVRPWFDDHLRSDPDQEARLRNNAPNLDRVLSNVWIVEALATDPVHQSLIARYQRMLAEPKELAALEPAARAVLADDWRAAEPDGPDRARLIELIGAVQR